LSLPPPSATCCRRQPFQVLQLLETDPRRFVAAQTIEDAFYYEARLDPAEWETLAAEYDRLDRPHRAAAVRHKREVLQILEKDPRHFVEKPKSPIETPSL
jgi:hypothetical protein